MFSFEISDDKKKIMDVMLAQDAVIFYTGSRRELISKLQHFRYEYVEVPDGVIENSNRQMNAEYQEKMVEKVILRYAAPIMLSYLLQQIYVLTDAIICGQVLPTEQVAGVNDTFALTLFFLQFAFGCTAGFSVITARYIGGGDKVGARRSFATQIYLTLAISLLLTVLALSLLPTLLGLINVHPENPVVYGAARDYCFYLFNIITITN